MDVPRQVEGSFPVVDIYEVQVSEENGVGSSIYVNHHFWKARNDLIFNHVNINWSDVLENLKTQAALWVIAGIQNAPFIVNVLYCLEGVRKIKMYINRGSGMFEFL